MCARVVFWRSVVLFLLLATFAFLLESHFFCFRVYLLGIADNRLGFLQLLVLFSVASRARYVSFAYPVCVCFALSICVLFAYPCFVCNVSHFVEYVLIVIFIVNFFVLFCVGATESV